ncbi:pimeloyl-ACP methyl ester carboxylesterase [Roseimicrobium gellanilyticum]|uniref:Pimeloyl-ACP methyl ester carboxylesterase n=1 Tax=Roseimicrobium gellanilyticum TaxID=748857 RepID=A0A366HMH2_9BACT|nr:alpha/beta fold hydrolase [Roseimicrobium gellanilyticum]RBP44339.1 pimeloyl-ACP methyl ester carboxylesterase [Roseimicrobium gellanilyticum]
MRINHIRRGRGKPLLLIHGMGGSWRSWAPILKMLAAEREVIAMDLPGFGKSEPVAGEVTVTSLANATAAFIEAQDLEGVDVVGSSIGANVALELARRGGLVGAVIALAPAGFGRDRQRKVYQHVMGMSNGLIRLLRKAMPFLASKVISRSLLFRHLSVRPSQLQPSLVLDEARSMTASASFDEALKHLSRDDIQHGVPPHVFKHPLVLAWGRQDRLCPVSQAELALLYFPDARLHFFDKCGHHPHWDAPREVAKLTLTTTRTRSLVPLAAIAAERGGM